MGVNIIDLSPPTLILPLRGGRRFFLTQLGYYLSLNLNLNLISYLFVFQLPQPLIV
jgi:hypothetical protein